MRREANADYGLAGRSGQADLHHQLNLRVGGFDWKLQVDRVVLFLLQGTNGAIAANGVRVDSEWHWYGAQYAGDLNLRVLEFLGCCVFGRRRELILVFHDDGVG